MPSFNPHAQTPGRPHAGRTLTRRAALTLGGMFLLTACGSAAVDQKRPEESASLSGSASGTASEPATASASATPSLAPALNAEDAERLRASLDKLFADGTYPQYSILVTGLDGGLTGTGATTAPGDLYAANADTARVPASTFKILTFFTLSRHANLQARLTTRAVRQGDALYLVAGGDSLLGAGASDPKQVVGRAGLATLAEQAVKAVAAGDKPTSAMPVYLDTALFTGPSV